MDQELDRKLKEQDENEDSRDEADIDSDYDEGEDEDLSEEGSDDDDDDDDTEDDQVNGHGEAKKKRPSNLKEVRANKKKMQQKQGKRGGKAKKPVKIEYETERNTTSKKMTKHAKIKNKLNF